MFASPLREIVNVPNHAVCCSAVPLSLITAAQVAPCLLITDIPCMIAPIADKFHPGLLQGGGALPRNAQGQVFLKELQHLGARACEYPDLHEVKVPPMEYPSPTTTASASVAHSAESVPTVYAAFAAGQPKPDVQPHLDFRGLLQRAVDVVEKNREVQATESSASGVSDWSSSPKRIADLAETALKSLHKQGWHAMTLFEVVLVYMLWFQAAAYAIPEDEAQGPAPRPAPRPAPGPTTGATPGMGSGAGSAGVNDDAPPVRDIADLRKSEYLLISASLTHVLRVAIGSTSTGTGLGECMTLPVFVSDDILFQSLSEEGTGDNMDEGAGDTPPTKLRDLGTAVHRYHEVTCSSSNPFPSSLVGGVPFGYGDRPAR